MIPLRDNVRTNSFAYVTYSLIALNVAIFFYEFSLAPEELQRFIMTWGYVPHRVSQVFSTGPVLDLDVGAIVSLLTSIFLHGGWLHVLGNMLYLYIFGKTVEDALGSRRFLAFYLGVGVAANLAQVLISPMSSVPGVGASGAIAGILGAYLLLYPRAGVLVLVPIFIFIQVVTLPAAVVLVFWFVIQLFQGTMSLAAGQAGAGGVAFWVHVAGFILGMLLVIPVRRRADKGKR